MATNRKRTATIAEPIAAPVPHELSEKFGDPDLVDRMFDYILDQFPEMASRVPALKAEVRAEFGGEGQYIAKRPMTERQKRVSAVLRLFNGRNASEVARVLNIGRATVYRILKQAGAAEA